jgi:hypothetical protein
MSKKVILAAVLVVLLALPVAAYAQVDLVRVGEAFVADLNAGEAEAAAAVVAEDATAEAPAAVTGAEGEGGDPSAPVQAVGKEEVEAWMESYIASGGNTELGECVAAGEVVTCDAMITSNALTGMGIGEVEGEVEMEVNAEGKIVAFNFTPTAESAAALSAAGAAAGAAEAAPETMAVTGGSDFVPLALVIVLGGLLLVANGLGLQWMGRLGRRID